MLNPSSSETPNFSQRQSVGARDEQQDVVWNQNVSDTLRLYVLADGMGGHRNGSLASQTAAQAFAAHIDSHISGTHPESALKAALYQANNALARVIKARPDTEGMGTTLVAVLLHLPDGAYSFVSVGDSPLYVFENGRLRRINENHAFAADLEKLVSAGQMSREEAAQHPARHAITSAVMGKDIPRIDVRSGVLPPDALLLLASDGLQTLDDAPDGDIATLLAQQGRDLDGCTQALLDAVAARGREGQDNTSVILVCRSEHEAHTAPVRKVANPTTLNSQRRPSVLNPDSGLMLPPPQKPKSSVFGVALLAGMAVAGIAGLLVLALYFRPPPQQQPEQAKPAASAPAAAASSAASVPVLPAPDTSPAASRPAAPASAPAVPVLPASAASSEPAL